MVDIPYHFSDLNVALEQLFNFYSHSSGRARVLVQKCTYTFASTDDKEREKICNLEEPIVTNCFYPLVKLMQGISVLAIGRSCVEQSPKLC